MISAGATASSEARLQAAREYVAAGLSLIPIDAKSKCPPEGFSWKVYQRRQPDDGELCAWVGRYPGFGVVGGKVSGHRNGDGEAKDALEILDLEAIAPLEEFRQLVEEAAPGLLGQLPRVKTPTDGRHIYYRCAIVEGNQKLAQRAVEVADADLPRTDDGALDKKEIQKLGLREIGGKYFKVRTLIETRGEGGQVLSPLCLPGTHPSGGVYKVLGGDLRHIPTIPPSHRDILLTAARACNEFVEPAKAKGRREAGREKPGADYNGRFDVDEKVRALLREGGWTLFRSDGLGELWSRPGVDDHCSARLFSDGAFYVFSSNAAPFAINEAYTPFGVYAELKHGGDYSAAAKALAAEGYGDQRKQQQGAVTSETAEDAPITWSEPRPIPDGLLPVPKMDSRLIPAAFRGWISDIADRLQVPLEFPAIPAIVAAASVIGNQIRIYPKAHDDWAVTPNLWGAVVGRPGTMKSPAILEAIKPLRRLCAEAAKTYEEDQKTWKFEKEAQKARQAATRKKMEQAAKNGDNLDSFKDDWADDEQSEPIERRYVINDSTVEKFGALLNQNPNGLLLFRDELTGWFRALDDDRRANDRAFFLECWNGDGNYTYDRIERGTLKIERATASVLGGIQPGPLQTYLRGALGCGEGDDGLLQRFQLMVFPDLPPDFEYVDRWPDSDAKNAAHSIFKALSAIPDLARNGADSQADGADKSYLRFTPDAQAFFAEWYSELRRDVRNNVYDHPAIEAHVAKYAKLMPALALVFEMINAANATPAFDGFAGAVSQDSAAISAAWCSFLLKHARRVYGLGLMATSTLAHTVAVHLQKGDLPELFTPRDIYYRGWSGLTTADSVKEPLDLLEHLGWIRGAAVSTGGRPTTQYKINPRVSEVKL